jgi:hypothetical protein
MDPRNKSEGDGEWKQLTPWHLRRHARARPEHPSHRQRERVDGPSEQVEGEGMSGYSR